MTSRQVGQVVVVYVVVGVAYILLSDWALYAYASDVHAAYRWGLWKGVGFVGVTAAALALLLLRLRSREEGRYRALFESHPAAMLVIDPRDGGILEVNPPAAALYGLSRDRLASMRVQDLQPEDAGEVGGDRVALARGESVSFWAKHRISGGTEREVHVTCGPVVLGGRPSVLWIVQDETAQRRGERALARLQRLLAMLTDVGQRIVRASAPGDLFRGVCEAAVAHGGFAHAWLGVADASGVLQPVAQASVPGVVPPEAWRTVREEASRGEGIAATALRQGQPVVVQVEAEGASARGSDEALRSLGAAWAVALPIPCGARPSAVLTLLRAQAEAFSAEEITMLRQASADLAFGWEGLERREAHEQADRRAEQAAARLAQYHEASPVVHYALDLGPEGFTPRWVSDNVERVLRHARTAALERSWWARHVHPDDLPAAQGAVDALCRGGAVRHEYRLRRGDGSYLWVLDEMRILCGPDGAQVGAVGVWVDVSDRRAAQEERDAKLRELEQWYRVTLAREDRIRELKAEVNALRARLGEPAPYESVAGAPGPAPAAASVRHP